jgi:hypothetical protein
MMKKNLVGIFQLIPSVFFFVVVVVVVVVVPLGANSKQF